MGTEYGSDESEFSRAGDTLTIRGDIDVAVVNDFVDALTVLVNEHPGATVWVDMDAVSFIDSSGLGALVGAQKRASEGGGAVMLRNLHDSPYKVFEITGLKPMFGVE